MITQTEKNTHTKIIPSKSLKIINSLRRTHSNNVNAYLHFLDNPKTT